LTNDSINKKPAAGYRYGDRYLRQGRFSIFISTHKELRDIAAENGKTAVYCFVSYIMSGAKREIVNESTLDWDEVDKIISNQSSVWKRSDGVEIANIPHNVIFKGGGK